jgi:prepilin signal peptidase PulO-like enzyme (type II secretory pathway)
MDEGDKEVWRHVSLATCLGVVLLASNSSDYHFWPCVLAALVFLAGLRYARAMATGVVPATSLLAVLVAAVLVLSGTVFASRAWASTLWFAMGLYDVITGHRRLGDFLPWLGGRILLAALIVGIGFLLLRRSSPKGPVKK